jgi:dihydropteroate synthase
MRKRPQDATTQYDDVSWMFMIISRKGDGVCSGWIPRSRIAIDPGIGFGKTFRHNLEILNQITLFHGLGVVVLLGRGRVL